MARDARPMIGWVRDAIFYHIYPLGLLGAPARNDFTSPPDPRLDSLEAWIPHLRKLGVDALYLGPVFESTAHGYDTADYFHLDRRLGPDESLARLIGSLHAAGIRVVLDAVLNHVGRDFWAFRDVRERGEASAYRDWFRGLRFDRRSPHGDPFSYEAWRGNFDLVKLEHRHPEVRRHLFDAVRHWLVDLDVDGLRLDAADAIDLDFLSDLAAVSRASRPDVWLLGEVIHGDYSRWANPSTLDSVTNYEAHKGLWSSLVDANYFEIAYALDRQSGASGIYRDLALYNFADNHDLDRVASRLTVPAQLGPLYCLLFTMPGIPSIYYGSEWGLTGRRTASDDRPLRPALDLARAERDAPRPDLSPAIARLAAIRHTSPALRHGSYVPLHVAHEQLVFARVADGESAVVLLNAASVESAIDVPLPPGAAGSGTWRDLLNGGEPIAASRGRLRAVAPACWARILVAE